MEYTPEVVRRFDSPRRAGELRAGLPGLVSGEAEDRTLQVWVRFQLQVIDGVVRAARPSGSKAGRRATSRGSTCVRSGASLGFRPRSLGYCSGSRMRWPRAVVRYTRTLGRIEAMAISLTSSAATRVKSFLEKRGRGVGLRIGVRKSGCSGYAYTIDYADAIHADDVVFDRDGVKVIIDPKSLSLIDGTEVDFVKDGLNEAFKFRNPNVKGECGCGESFTV
jgi:iron-sulfur cluster assembly protein